MYFYFSTGLADTPSAISSCTLSVVCYLFIFFFVCGCLFVCSGINVFFPLGQSHTKLGMLFTSVSVLL